MAERSAKYEKVRYYFAAGLWTEQMVRSAVGRWITEAEAGEILGGAAEVNEGS